MTNLIFISFLILFKSFFLLKIIKILALYSFALIFSYLVLTFYFFKKHKRLVPSFNYFSKSKINDILSMGGSFFIVQIAVISIFSVDNYIILQLLGSEQVSVFNVVFKLFSIFTIVFGIIVFPFWTAFTEANEKNDVQWMRATMKKLNLLFLMFILCIATSLFAYQPILDMWMPVNNRIVPSFNLVIALSIFVIISTWNNIYSIFLNGVGIVKIQVRTAIIGALLNVPLAVFFIKFMDLGLEGIAIAMCVSLSLFSFWGPIVTYRFLRNKVIER